MRARARRILRAAPEVETQIWVVERSRGWPVTPRSNSLATCIASELVVEVRKCGKDSDMEGGGSAVTGRMNEIHPIGKTVIHPGSIADEDDRKCPLPLKSSLAVQLRTSLKMSHANCGVAGSTVSGHWKVSRIRSLGAGGDPQPTTHVYEQNGRLPAAATSTPAGAGKPAEESLLERDPGGQTGGPFQQGSV